MKRTVLAIVGGIAMLVLGFFVLNSYIYNQKQVTTEVVEPYRATLSGEYVCLPHKDGSPLSAGECETGLKTEAGEYYAVNFFLMSQGSIVIEPGQHFTANGVVTTKRTDPEKLERYPIAGEFSVTDSVVIESTDDETTACSAEAMLCPDGSVVGRSGPNCEFATCPTSPTNASTADTTDTTVRELENWLNQNNHGIIFSCHGYRASM